MKFLKLKSILFSLLAITMVTVFLSSCEQETIIETDENVLSTAVRNSNTKIVDISFQSAIQKVIPYVIIEDNKYILDKEIIESLGFDETQTLNILEYFKFYNDSVIPQAKNLNAEEILKGKDWIINSEKSYKATCCGTSGVEGTITSRSFKVWFNACDFAIVSGGGCFSLSFLGPVGWLASGVCTIAAGYIGLNCSCGMWVDYEVTWTGLQAVASGCQDCPCDCSSTNKTDEFSLDVVKNLSTFTSSSLKSSVKDLMNLYISNEDELQTIFNSTDEKYTQVQEKFQVFWTDAQPLIQKGFSSDGNAMVTKKEVVDGLELVNELSNVVESKDLKTKLQGISSNLKLMEGKEIKEAFKAFDAQPLNNLQ